jgi:paraquat-inducible protein B
MSKPAGKTLIGIFVLGAISLLVISVLMLGSEKFFRNTIKAVCFFEGSVGGLSVGAPVVFNGVRIGVVTDIVLRYDTRDLKTTIPVTVEIDPKLVQTVGPLHTFEEDLKPLIAQGLRARLELQSILTGMLEVGLGYYPDTPVRLVGNNQEYPEIPTIPSQEIMKRIEQLPLEAIAKNVEASVEGINRLVNSPEIMQTVRSISQAADETRQLAHDLDAKSGPVLSGLEGAVGDARNLIRNADGQIGPVATSLKDTLASIKKASDEAGATFRQAQQTLTVLEGDIGEDSELMYELEKTIKEVGGAGKAIQSLANTIERQPESLLFGKKQR